MSPPTPPPMTPGLNARLSVMMFLQYAVWGAWLPLFYPYLDVHHGLGAGEIGQLFALGACGALLAPFIAGQIADRWFHTERFLALSHIAGAALVWQLASVETYDGLLLFTFLYSVIYAPTIPLTNSLSFHHIPDRDRDFGRVRLFGTIGWIVVGIGIGQWLLHRHTLADGTPEMVRALQHAGMADAFRLSAILGAVMGVFCFTLPRTPPQKGKEPFAPKEALREITARPRTNPLVWLFLFAFPVSVVHQFYFVHTAGFLGSQEIESSAIQTIFGVGGGGLMTVGQMGEILVLACMPLLAKRFSRRQLLLTGVAAYALRFFVFAYVPAAWAVIPALALHGLCFGCFFFVAFLIVDEHTTGDVRASAQSLFNFIVIGVGIIVGNLFAGWVGESATQADGSLDYAHLFGVPAWIAVAVFLLMLWRYPRKGAPAAD